jgi:hypothetical protein
MKKLLYLLGIFLFVAVSFATPASAGAPAIDDTPPPPAWANAPAALFLPVISSPTGSYTVSGQIKDRNDAPLSGVSVSSDSGQTAETDANGVYSMKVTMGQRQISAALAGKSFDPAPAWINVNQDVHNMNFSAGAACTTPIANSSFESILYWNPISGSASGYTPFYTDFRAHTGLWSGYTGIPVGWLNLESWSRWRSHEITIPADASSAAVSMYFFPLSQEAYMAREAMEVDKDLAGMNMDDPHTPSAYDRQYVVVTDMYNNYLGTLLDVRRNDQAWLSTGALSLMAYKGQTIKLEFGVYNDGYGGVTAAYFDDAYVSVCTGTSTSCTTTTQLIVNPNFENPGTGWTISNAANKSAYTTSFFYDPTQSMQSGQPIGSTYIPGWTTSEFFQYITIPANAASAHLSMRLLPRSTDPWGYHLDQQAKMDALVAARNPQGEPSAPLAEESQYGYLCYNGECASPNVRTFYTLFRWFPIDSANWLYRSYDVTALRGQTFGVLFGAQDYGDGWNTVLYVDDVKLDVCTP